MAPCHLGYTDFHKESPSVETGLTKPEVVKESYVVDYTRATLDVLVKEETGGNTDRWLYGLQSLQVKIASEGTDWWGQHTEQDVLTAYTHHDRLGSIVNLTDKYGRNLARADYQEYGEIAFYESITVSGGYRRITPQLVYTNHEWDDVLDLYYAKARFYDPSEKRFLSMDPVKGTVIDPQTLVPYVYCVDNPLKYTDPLGLRYSLAEGTIAHIIITAYIQFLYPTSINDTFVYGLTRTKSGRGRPDIVIESEGKYQVYEIKSENYLSFWTRRYTESAFNQLESYIEALNNFPEKNTENFPHANEAVAGTVLDWTTPRVLPYIVDNSKVIEVWTRRDTPGMIFYKIRDRKPRDRDEGEEFITKVVQVRVHYYTELRCECASKEGENFVNVDNYKDLGLNNSILFWLKEARIVCPEDGGLRVEFADGTTYTYDGPAFFVRALNYDYSDLLQLYEKAKEAQNQMPSSDGQIIPFLPIPNVVPIPVPAPAPVLVPGFVLP